MAANAAAAIGFGKAHRKAKPATTKPRPTGPEVAASVKGAPAVPADTHVYDMVINGGRVMDPESGYDQVANVGIDGGTVTQITKATLTAKTSAATISAHGKVVAPGFIDLLSYMPDDHGAHYKIADGVTTNLGMHGLDADATDYFAQYTGRCMVNFGGAFRDPYHRNKHLGLQPGQEASASQISQLGDILRQQLAQGWIGVDFEPEYDPGTDQAEMTALARIAKEHEVPCFFHGRYSAVGTNAATLDEIINVAKDTGAAVHVEHIISTGGTFDMANSLKRVERAKDAGYDVSACMYPYDFWATYLASPRFDPGWQQRFRITYNDLQIAGTDVRLNAGNFGYYQRQNKLAAAFAIPEADVVTCIEAPWVMIGSDAILTSGNNHPRSTGCFSRTIGRYAREKKAITLMEAVGKMTILPAKRLEKMVPGLTKKGRLQRGVDADITVFDPETILDQSTVADPAVESAGVEYVIINGQLAKTPAGVDDSLHAGRPLVATFA